jgi:hypothetical protein
MAVPSCRQRDVFWPVLSPFFFFFFDFGCQICSSSPTSDWHAPPSRVLRRLPPLPPQDPVLSVAGDQRVVPMRQWALRCLVRVWATRRFFLADLGGFWSFSVGPPSGWRRCQRVAFKRRCPVSWPLSSTAGNLFWVVFCFSVVCFFFLFFWVTVCFCWVQILWEYLLANYYI